jgi:hypothetical protein
MTDIYTEEPHRAVLSGGGREARVNCTTKRAQVKQLWIEESATNEYISTTGIQQRNFLIIPRTQLLL